MKRIIFALCLLVFASVTLSAQKTKTYALLLAVQDYPENPLSNTARDVMEFGRILKNAKVETSMITGTNVNRRNVEATIDKLIRISEVKPYQYNFILFFSGHGGDGIMAFYDGVYRYSTLFEKLAKLKARNVFVFVDDCHSGSALADMLNQPSGKVNPRMTFFASCKKEESSIDGRLLAHGLFTQALVKGIRGYSDKNDDRGITVRELFKYIHDDVVIRCEKFNELPVEQRTASDGTVVTYNMHPQLFGPDNLHNEVVLKW